MPGASAPKTTKAFDILALWCIGGIDMVSPGVSVEGVEGAELGQGPVVFIVPELLAGPDDEIGCLRFRPF